MNESLIDVHLFIFIVGFGSDVAVSVCQRHPRHQSTSAQLRPHHVIVQGENFDGGQSGALAAQNSRTTEA